MYHLIDPTHTRTLGGVRYIYIWSPADGVNLILRLIIKLIFNYFIFSSTSLEDIVNSKNDYSQWRDRENKANGKRN